MRNLHNRSFVKELDFTTDELRFLLSLSQAFGSDVRLVGSASCGHPTTWSPPPTSSPTAPASVVVLVAPRALAGS